MYAAAGVTLCIILLSIPLIRYSQTKKMSIHITEGGDEEGMEIELAGADAGRPEGTGNPNDFYKTSESGGDVAPSSGRLSPSSPHSREASRSNSPHPTGNFSGTSPHQHHQHEQLQQQQGNTYEDALIASFIEANEGSLRTQRPPNVEDNKNIPTDAEMEIAIMESLELQAKMQSRDEEDLQLAILQSVRTSSLQRNRQYQALTTQSSSKTNAHHAEQQQDQQKLQQRQSVQVKAQSQLGPEQGQERGHGQEQGQGQEQQSSRSGVRSLRVTNPPSPLSGASPPTAAMGFERVSTKIDGDSPL